LAGKDSCLVLGAAEVFKQKDYILQTRTELKSLKQTSVITYNPKTIKENEPSERHSAAILFKHCHSERIPSSH
jgi:hypothetical protein